jgi:hypothetical protein
MANGGNLILGQKNNATNPTRIEDTQGFGNVFAVESWRGSGISSASSRFHAVEGTCQNGVGIRGTSITSQGVHGMSSFNHGVVGIALQKSAGVYGHSQRGAGVVGSTDNREDFAGYFWGRVKVNGYLYKSGGGFWIDHPSDPGRKYLSHSFVESSDMKNLYDGIQRLNNKGEAVIRLPAWCEALNQEFRYQLTAIGAHAPGLHVAQEIRRGRFKIAGGRPGMKVSWQVTGIRRDAWAKANRRPVEQAKSGRDRGRYLHPELHGKPLKQSVDWDRHPKNIKTPARRRAAGRKS